MSSRNKFAAIIAISGQMDKSVANAFKAISQETSKLGKEMAALRSKESLAFEAKDQEAAIKREEAELNRLIAKEKKAQAAAASGGPAEQRAAEKATAAVQKQIRVVDQEYAAMHKLDDQLKRNGIDSSKLDKETERLGSSITRMDRRMAITGHLQEVGSAFGGVTSELKSLGMQAGLVAGTVGYLFKSTLFDNATKFDSLKTQLRNVSLSSADAEKNFQWITNFEPTVPYKIDDVTAAFVKLKNIGLDPTSGILTTVANAAAQFGETDMTRPVDALTSAIFRHRYTMLGGYGIGATADPKKKGMETFTWFDQMGKKQVKTVDTHNMQMVASTIQAIWNDKYQGASDRFMKTWAGMISSLNTRWEMFELNIMNAGLFDWMKGKLGNLLDWINTNTKNGNLIKWANDIGKAIMSAGQSIWDTGLKIVSAWKWANDAFQPILGDSAALKLSLGILAAVEFGPLVISIGQLGVALYKVGAAAVVGIGPIGWLVIGVVAAVALASYEIYTHLDFIKSTWAAAWTSAKDIFGNAFASICDLFNATVDLFTGFFTGDFTAFKADVTAFEDHFLAAIRAIADAWNSVRSTFSDGLFGAAGVFGSGKISAPSAAQWQAGEAQVAANKARYGRAGVIRGSLPQLPPVAGTTTTVNNSPTYHITVNTASGQDPAKVAADTKSRLQAQEPALAGGYLHD
jgi:hypothetical protein